MTTGIKVEGPRLESLSLLATAKAIASILEAGYENGAEQATIQKALDTFQRLGAQVVDINNVQVTL